MAGALRPRRNAPVSFSFAVSVCALASAASLAEAQNGGDILIDRNRIDRATPPVAAPTPPPQQPRAPAPSAPLPQVVVDNVIIEGASALPAQSLAALARAQLSGPLTLERIRAAIRAVTSAYASAGYALHNAYAPAQTLADGALHIRVIEGYVAEVAVAGTLTPAEIRLLQGYAAPVTREKPLRAATLERAMALAAATPGLTVKARYEQMPNDASAVRLVLDVVKDRLELGSSVTNQGARLLGRTQFEFLGTGNGVARAGDRFQLGFGFPIEPKLYQFVSTSYVTPIGFDGLTVQGGLTYLRTRPGYSYPEGDVVTATVKGAYPLLRRRDRSADLLASFDTLSSDNAVFGYTFSSNRLRVLRLGGAYTRATAQRQATATATVSAGLDAFGARSDPFGGDPSFVKVVVRGGAAQKLGTRTTASVRLAGQYAADALPSSEQFYFGGSEFGRGLDSATASSRRGAAAALQIAHDVTPPTAFLQTQALAYFDVGALDPEPNRILREDTFASTGVGVSFGVAMAKLNLQLAKPLAGVANKSTRLLVGASSRF
jgi:hemolysin activation/secretion protein